MTQVGRIGLWALNIILFAVLADVAVESVASLSLVWPVALGCVLVYGALLVILWHRIDLAVKWELSVAVLAGLLAYSGWRSGTLSTPGGLTIFGQSADLAAAALVTFVLLSAVVTIVFVQRIPWWLRVVIGCIVVYSLVPFVYALAHGAGLSSALSTDAPWPKDPYWVRGSFMAASVILPVTGLAAFILAGAFLVARKGQSALRLAAAGLALICASQMSGLEAVNAGLPSLAALEPRAPMPTWAPSYNTTGTAQSQSTTQPGSGTTNTTGTTQAGTPVTVALAMPGSGDYQTASAQALPTAKPLSADPEQLAPQFDQVVDKLQPAQYEIDERAQTLGSDVSQIFAFVRDQIRYESYPGILLGSFGAYAARAGNAFDRSLLLAHILQSKKVPVRFATCQLAQADAAKLFDRIFEPQARVAGATPSAQTLGDAVALKDRIYARGRRDYAVIRSALGGQLPDVTLMSRDDVIKEIQSHMWVQAQTGGRWIDLDTAFADATPGKAYCAAAATVDTPTNDMMQQVTIRVTSDTLAAGDINHTTAAEVTVPAYQLLDQQIFITHTPPGLKALVGPSDNLAPMIDIAGDAHIGQPVVFSETPEQAGGKIGGAISALGTPGPALAATQLVTEWLEFEIKYPGGRTETTRRALIDRAGDVWRAAPTRDPATLRSLKRDAAGVPLECETVYNVWFSAGGHDLYAYGKAVQSFLHAFGPVDNSAPQEQPSFEQSVWPLALRDFGWIAWSDQVAVPSLNDSSNLRFYPDSPRIAVFALGADPRGTPGGIFTQSDLRRDTLRGIARDPSANAAVIEHKIWFGALEGALEQEMLATDAASDPTAQSTITSTSALLTSDGVVVLRPGSSGQLPNDKNSAALASTALNAGDTLVMPRVALSGGQGGWWQISHSGGDTRAVLGPDLNAGNSYSLGGRGTINMPRRFHNPAPGGGGGYKPPGGRGMGRPPARGCGSEYSCLTAIMTFFASLAFWQLGALVAEVIFFVVLGYFAANAP